MTREQIHIEQHSFTGTVWVIGWLFTIGFLNLSFGSGILAIITWPYLLGIHFAI